LAALCSTAGAGASAERTGAALGGRAPTAATGQRRCGGRAPADLVLGARRVAGRGCPRRAAAPRRVAAERRAAAQPAVQRQQLLGACRGAAAARAAGRRPGRRQAAPAVQPGATPGRPACSGTGAGWARVHKRQTQLCGASTTPCGQRRDLLSSRRRRVGRPPSRWRRRRRRTGAAARRSRPAGRSLRRPGRALAIPAPPGPASPAPSRSARCAVGRRSAVALSVLPARPRGGSPPNSGALLAPGAAQAASGSGVRAPPGRSTGELGRTRRPPGAACHMVSVLATSAVPCAVSASQQATLRGCQLGCYHHGDAPQAHRGYKRGLAAPVHSSALQAGHVAPLDALWRAMSSAACCSCGSLLAPADGLHSCVLLQEWPGVPCAAGRYLLLSRAHCIRAPQSAPMSSAHHSCGSRSPCQGNTARIQRSHGTAVLATAQHNIWQHEQATAALTCSQRTFSHRAVAGRTDDATIRCHRPGSTASRRHARQLFSAADSCL
jgi:hypothetical protein